MRCVIQRVTHASVTVEGELVSEIGNGFLVLVGAEDGDGESDVRYCADKIAGLRVFEDAQDKMNLSVTDAGAGMRPARTRPRPRPRRPRLARFA